MVTLFCLRLSFGLLLALLVLPPATIHPRFYRTHLLTVLGLLGLALLTLSHQGHGLPLFVLAAIGLSFLGAILWSVEGAPGGRLLLLVTLATLAVELLWSRPDGWRASLTDRVRQAPGWAVVDELTASALLGFALTAMLLGHSYLINPSMTLVPLKRLIVGLGLSLLARTGLAGVSVALWTSGVTRLSLTSEALLWLPLRWILGLIVPGVLCFLSWRTTLLRNTQSSTGILYVVFVFICIGELTAQLLLNVTGYFL